MEQLLSYLASQPQRTDAEWADTFGISRVLFNMIRNGKALPSRKLAQKIEAETRGAVHRLDWETEDGRPVNAPPPKPKPAKSQKGVAA